MNTCSLKIRKESIKFAALSSMAIKSNKNDSIEIYVTNLRNKLVNESYNPFIIMKLIEASYKLGNNRNDIRGLSTQETVKDIDAYVLSKGLSEQEMNSNLSQLENVKGFENYSNGVSTIKALGLSAISESNITPTAEDFKNHSDVKPASNAPFTAEENVVFKLDPNGESTAAKKALRLEKTKELSPESPEYWGAFISSYFSGMTSQAILFNEWARDKFYTKLTDFSSSRNGFLTDINEKINELKEELEVNLQGSIKQSLSDRTAVVLKSLFKVSEEAKERYFTEVLLADFDFVLSNLIKSIKKSDRGTAKNNQLVYGFEGDLNGPVLLNISKIPGMFENISGNNYKIKGVTVDSLVIENKGNIDNELQSIPYNTSSFIKDDSLLNDSFYYLENDNKYFFRDINGNNVDISPVSYYSYSTDNNRNVSYVDHFIDPTSSSTSFINNIFPLFKLISTNDSGREVFGRRMKAVDFLTISQFLTDAGSNLDVFIDNLTELSKDIGSLKGKIAKSLLIQVFNKTDFFTVGDKDYYSIYQAAKKSSLSGKSLNEDIIKALHSALINKEHLKYIVVDEKLTTVTRGANNTNNAEVLNDGLVQYIIDKNTTKKTLADAIEVVDNKINIRLSYNKLVPLSSINSVDSIGDVTSMKDVAKAIGLESFFNRVYDHYKNDIFNTVLEANSEILKTFNNILTLAAANIKTSKNKSRLKLSEEVINKGFPHDNYRYIAPSAIMLPLEQNNLSRIFLSDPTQNITIAGRKTATMTTPNREGQILKIIEDLNHFNLNVVKTPQFFNPFVKTNNRPDSYKVPTAVVDGTYIKSPITENRDVISVSDWDTKIRIEHAIVSGFLQGPKNVGKEFFIQPVNYSDKSLPNMHKITTEKNLLNTSLNELMDYYIDYFYEKNIALQHIVIDSFSEFILSNETNILNHIGEESKTRLEAFKSLKNILINKTYLEKPDMLKVINKELYKVGISKDFFKFSDADLDLDVDYTTINRNEDIAVLKPGIGVRAEHYSNRVLAKKQLMIDLAANKDFMQKKLKISNKYISSVIKGAVKKGATIKTNVSDFYARFYLINGIYGHALKTLTMGDESYFPAKYKDIEEPSNITKFRLPIKNILSVVPNNSQDIKSVSKASISNKYIGYGEGIEGSSTADYAKQVTESSGSTYVNSDEYNENDVVFVSVPGNRGLKKHASLVKDNQNKTIKKAIEAIESGAVIITDNESYTVDPTNTYNSGELRLYKNLKAKGYFYTDVNVRGEIVGAWSKEVINDTDIKKPENLTKQEYEEYYRLKDASEVLEDTAVYRLLQAMPKISKKDAEKQVGGKVGVKKDINPFWVANNGAGVEATAGYLYRELFEDSGEFTEDEVKDFIIDALGKTKTSIINSIVDLPRLEQLELKVSEYDKAVEEYNKKANNPTAFNINKYYRQVELGIRTGLEENESMLVGQFKRAQSSLSRGNIYSERTTVEGLKRRYKKNNLLQYLSIRDSLLLTNDDGEAAYSYDFDSLTGKTVSELYAMGVIDMFEDGSLVKDIPGGFSLTFNIGNDKAVLGDSYDAVQEAIDMGVDSNIATGVKELLKTITVNDVKKSKAPLGMVFGPKTNTDRTGHLTLNKLKSTIEEIKNNTFIAMPDVMSSITVTDPVSYINLLNSMDNSNVENSDAIQFIHPIFHEIMNHARGNELGAFTTDNYEAIKTLTTTMEYGKYRQVLQKKSVQMPFSESQMAKTGTMGLYNTLKTLNTAIPFNKRKLKFIPRFYNSDGELIASTTEVNQEFKNMQELYEFMFNHELYIKGSDTVWKSILEVLRNNSENMFNFVGLITVPSNQKTGRKKLNRFEEVFNNRESLKGSLNIDYVANEFNYEILTKAHEYDISDKFGRSSSISLLSQLVNAIPFGGLSNLNSNNLQIALQSKMVLNKAELGRGFASVAKDLKTSGIIDFSNRLTYRLLKGNISVESLTKESIVNTHTREELVSISDTEQLTGSIVESEKVNAAINYLKKGLSEKDIEAYVTTVRNGISSIASLAFKDSDSELLKNIVAGTGIKIDPDGKASIEGDKYSLDAPAVRSKVMGTLRAGLFKDTVKMKMKGFIGTVSAAHMTISRFVSPGGMAVSRAGFIDSMLLNHINNKSKTPVMGEVIDLKTMSKDEIEKYITPFDKIAIKNKTSARNKWVLVPLYSIDILSKLADPDYEMIGVRTPDTYENNPFTYEEFKAQPETILINFRGDTSYKWYLEEIYSEDDLREAAINQELIENTVEKYNLKWNRIVRKDGTGSIENTDEYKDFYRLSKEGAPESMLESARAGLTIRTHTRDENNEKVWEFIPSEVVLPNYLKDSYNLPDNISLHRIIGTVEGMEKVNATKYFTKKFKPQKETYSNYVDTTRRIYASIAAKHNKPYVRDIIEYLDNNEINKMLSPKGKIYIKNKVREYEATLIKNKVDSFIKSLDAVLTRIPGQSKQSGFVGRVIEFLDSQGNATFASTEHLVNTGGDLDIDTLSVLLRPLDKEGIIQDYTPYLDNTTSYSQGMLLEAYYKEQSDSEKRIKKHVQLSNALSEERIKDVKYKYDTNTDPDKELELKKSYLDNLKNIISPERERLLIKRNAKKIYDRYAMIADTAIADSIFKSLSDVSTAVESNTPISMGMLDPIIERLENQNLVVNIYEDMTISGENFLSIFKYEDLAAQGKEGIGIYATVLKINSAIQAAKSIFDKYYKKRWPENLYNPFNFVHTLEYTDTQGEPVQLMAKGFADIDRFPIINMIESNNKIQNAVKKIIDKTKDTDITTVNTIIALLEDSLITAINTDNNNHNTLNIIDKTKLANIFKNEGTNRNIGQLAVLFNDITTVFTEEQKQDMLVQFNVDVTNQKQRKEFSNLLSNTFISKRTFKENNNVRKYVDSTSKTLFNISLPDSVLDSDNILEAFKDYIILPENSEILSNAFSTVVGKQLSNDMQSQYLSAATDNAKELKLGKIKSNTLTNPIISTMMLLGYTPDTIVDFLSDPKVDKVLTHFLRKKSNLERTSITESEIKNSRLNVNSASVRSLIDIVKVGDRVSTFRALRSLHENSQIEQHRIDKILTDISEKVGLENLYRALITDDLTALSKYNNKKDRVFNPAMFIFLHPQTRALLMNMYDIELSILPAISNVAPSLKTFIGNKNISRDSYKNTEAYFSSLQVLSFLNSKLDNGSFLSGSIATFKEGVYYLESVPLNNLKNRDKFVSGFGEYLESGNQRLENIKKTEELTDIGGTAAISGLSTSKIFGGSSPVYSYSKLSNSNVDSVDIATIFESIKELKIVTGNQVVDDINKEIYENLSLYALIVSGGQVKKGSMVELFEDINRELSKHVDTLPKNFYIKNGIKNKDIKNILFNKLNTDEDLTKAWNRKKSIEEQEYLSGRNIEQEIIEDAGDIYEDNQEDLEGAQFSSRKKKVNYNKEIDATIFRGTLVTKGRVYALKSNTLKRAIFVGRGVGKISYRVFKRGPKEALPEAIISPDKFNSKSTVSESIREDLNKIGLQIGLDIKYQGKDARVLAFAGKKRFSAGSILIDSYVISTDEGIGTVFGLHLLKENDDLFLRGNKIEPRSRGNLFDYLVINDKYKKIEDSVPDVFSKEGKIKDNGLSVLYTREAVLADNFLRREREHALSKDILKLPNKKADIPNSNSYNNFYKKPSFIEATSLSTDVLIPSFTDVNGAKSETAKELQYELLSTINGLFQGEFINFYSYNFTQNNVVTGLDIIKDVINSSGIETTKRGNTYYLGKNKSFKLDIIPRSISNKDIEFVITRENNKSDIYLLDGKFTEAEIEIDASLDIRSYKNKSLNVVLHGLENNIINNVEMLSVSEYIDGKGFDFIVINPSNDKNKIIYLKDNNIRSNTKYYKVSKRKVTGVVKKGKDAFISNTAYDSISDKIKSSQKNIKNKAC